MEIWFSILERRILKHGDVKVDDLVEMVLDDFPCTPTAPEPARSSPKARPQRILAQVYSTRQKAIANPERTSDRED